MVNWRTIPLGPWLPDQPALANPGTAIATNALAITAKSYGPAADFAVYSEALTARCQGGFTFVDNGGNATTVAGDATKLYRIISGSLTPDDASRLAGGAYSTPADGQWRFCISNGRCIATNYADDVQSYTIETSTDFAQLAAAAPKARYCADVMGFLLLGNTNDGVSGEVPHRVWWSKLRDPATWPTIGSAAAAAGQSDYNDFPGEGGWIQGIAGNLGAADCAILMERAVWRGIYAGPPAVFNFYPAANAEGCIAPNSLIVQDSWAFYLGEHGFHKFDGANAVPIGNQRVDDWFFDNWDDSYPDRVWGAADPDNHAIVWAFPTIGDNGLCSKLLYYFYDIDRWSVVQPSTTMEVICRALSFGYTLDGLDALGFTMETLPYSLDSRVWTGGNMLLGGFNSAHKLGYFNGSALGAVIETTESEIGQGRRVLVRNSRPLVSGGTTATTVAVATREKQSDNLTWSAETAVNSDGTAPPLQSGRYARGRISIPAGETWDHCFGIEVDAEPLGEY